MGGALCVVLVWWALDNSNSIMMQGVYDLACYSAVGVHVLF